MGPKKDSGKSKKVLPGKSYNSSFSPTTSNLPFEPQFRTIQQWKDLGKESLILYLNVKGMTVNELAVALTNKHRNIEPEVEEEVMTDEYCPDTQIMFEGSGTNKLCI